VAAAQNIGGAFARRGSGVSNYARMRSGLTVEQTSSELTRILSAIKEDGTAAPVGWFVYVETLLARNTSGYWTTGTSCWRGRSHPADRVRECGGLLLARGATRMHEVAIRASIGAAARDWCVNCLRKACSLRPPARRGCAAGVVDAGRTGPQHSVASLDERACIAQSARALAFSVILTLVTGVLFGLAPALRLSRVRVSGALARGNRRSGAALSRRGGRWLIGVEVALALVLVTGAALMIKSFNRMMSVDLGFKPESFVTVQASPSEFKAPYSRRTTPPRRHDPQWPDVEAVGAVNHLPLMGTSQYGRITTDGGKAVSLTIRRMTAGYFEALGLEAVQGACRLSRSTRVAGRRHRQSTRRETTVPEGPAAGRVITLANQPWRSLALFPTSEIRAPMIAIMPASMRESVELFAMYHPAPADRPEPMVVVVRPGQTRQRSSNGCGKPRRVQARAPSSIASVRERNGRTRRS
jgi:hypothetical protein